MNLTINAENLRRELIRLNAGQFFRVSDLQNILGKPHTALYVPNDTTYQWLKNTFTNGFEWEDLVDFNEFDESEERHINDTIIQNHVQINSDTNQVFMRNNEVYDIATTNGQSSIDDIKIVASISYQGFQINIIDGFLSTESLTNKLVEWRIILQNKLTNGQIANEIINMYNDTERLLEEEGVSALGWQNLSDLISHLDFFDAAQATDYRDFKKKLRAKFFWEEDPFRTKMEEHGWAIFLFRIYTKYVNGGGDIPFTAVELTLYYNM